MKNNFISREGGTAPLAGFENNLKISIKNWIIWYQNSSQSMENPMGGWGTGCGNMFNVPLHQYGEMAIQFSKMPKSGISLIIWYLSRHPVDRPF